MDGQLLGVHSDAQLYLSVVPFVHRIPAELTAFLSVARGFPLLIINMPTNNPTLFPAQPLKPIHQLRRDIINVRPVILRRALQVQHAILNIHLAVRVILELLHDPEGVLVRADRLQQALLDHLVLAHLDVLHLVRQRLEVLEREVRQRRLPVVAERTPLHLGRGIEGGKVGLEVGGEGDGVGGLAEQLGDLLARLLDLGVVVVVDAEADDEGHGRVAGGRVERLGQGRFVAAVVDVGAEVARGEEDAEAAVEDVAPAVGEAGRCGLLDVQGQDVGVRDGVEFAGEGRAEAAREVLDLVDGAVDVAGELLEWEFGRKGDGEGGVRLDAAAEGLLGVAVVVVGPDGVGVELDGPGGAGDLGELLLKVGLVVVVLVTDWACVSLP